MSDNVLEFTRPVAKVGRVKASLLKWLGVPLTLQDSMEFWREFGGGESHSGEPVTINTMLQLETFWACTGLISETVATMPLAVYRRLPERAVAHDHQLYFLLHDQPNADMRAPTLIEILMLSMLLWGNGFAEIVRSGSTIVSLDFINPADVTMKRLRSGAIEYSWRALDGAARTALADDMFHVIGKTLNGIIGLSPVTYARQVMGGATAIDKSAAKMFRQGLLLAGTFETDNPVREGLRAEFQKRLEAYQGAINAGRAPLLEGGIKYKPISINPNDAQMLETRSFSVEQICRWFRVPPFMVGHTEKSTSWGTGMEQQSIGFLTYTLHRWLQRIEEEAMRKLLSVIDRKQFFVEFNFEGLLRADSAARAAFYSTMTQNGIYTRDNCRTKENLPKMGGNAAVLTVQSNLVPLDKLGSAIPTPTQNMSPPDTPPGGGGTPGSGSAPPSDGGKSPANLRTLLGAE